MQTQVAISFGCLQLRHDFYLSGTKGISSDAIQQLRHASAVDATTLFPRELLVALNNVNYQSLQTKALLRISAVSQRGHRDGQGRGGRRNFGRRDTERTHPQRREDGYRSKWYEFKPFAVRSSIPLLTPLLTPFTTKTGGRVHRL